MRRIILILGFAVLVGAAYFFWPEATHRTNHVEMGPYAAQGVIENTEISLVRRGTHVFVADDATELFAESSLKHLRDFVGKRVAVEGTVRENTSPEFLPVLVVTSIELLSGSETERTVGIPELGMSLTIPSSWTHGVTAGRVTLSGSGGVMMTVDSRAPGTTLPAGTPVRIAGRNGVRQVLIDGNITVTLPVDDRWYVFTSMTGGADADAFNDVLRSVVFDARASSSAASQSQSSSVALSGSGATVCGGAAGILCPQGSFCAITDSAQGTGVCRKTR